MLRPASLALATICVGMSSFAVAQSPAPASPAAAPAAPALVPFEMRLGDLMNTLVQPRHAKLTLAGLEANWPLATYVLKELRQSLDGIAKAVPRWNRLPMGDMMRSLTTKPLADVEEAIRARDKAMFATAMTSVTRACNSCHTASDHTFIIITTPDQSAFPNQNFRPNR